MARIFPAGGGTQVSWMDKVGESKDVIGTAAIDLKVLKKLAGDSWEEKADDAEEVEEDVKPEDADKAPEGEAPEAEDKKEVAEDKEEGEEHEEGESKEFEAGEGEEKAEAAPAVEQAAAAVETAKEALEEASVALEDAGATGDEEVEIPVSLEGDTVTPLGAGDEMVEVEVEAPIDGMGAAPAGDIGAPAPVTDMGVPGVDEISTTSEPCCATANQSAKFYKIASLSPKNKKKLKDYWVTALGYDPGFVAMMLKDYNPKSGASKEE